ncbi:MAG: N-acetyltransferase [Blastomonas sp.]
MSKGEIRVSPVRGKAALSAFVNLAYRLNANDPKWVPPLKQEVFELLDPGKNPFFSHAEVQPMIATRGGKIVGRICAHIDQLAISQPAEQGFGPGTGNWGMMEAEDRSVSGALIGAAEDWLRERNMTRALGPLSLSVWDEPGLLTKGHGQSPRVMMGHHNPEYQAWIEELGYRPVKKLVTYELDVTNPFPPLIQRIVASGERNERIRIRSANLARLDEEARILVDILNDAWSDNWGFVPITDQEISYAVKKMKPLLSEELIMFAELDGEPVAFMMALPDINAVLKPLNGNMFPFGWARLLLWLRARRSDDMRVPLMGVRKHLQSSRMASQLAFMLIETIRVRATRRYRAKRAEIGWILEDNQGMVAIAEAIGSHVNREYLVYDKAL